MSRKQIVLILFIGVLLAPFVSSLLLHESRIAKPAEWPDSIERFANPILGTIRVHDVRNNEELFRYNNDQDFNPTKFQKTASGEWIITFEDRRR